MLTLEDDQRAEVRPFHVEVGVDFAEAGLEGGSCEKVCRSVPGHLKSVEKHLGIKSGRVCNEPSNIVQRVEDGRYSRDGLLSRQHEFAGIE